ncbi:hypothetical protein HA466_0004690 [Hirschfeldia incana]|nr:hypothetical protein HA466_0004690 [Hirschfeldia incana]
MARILEKTVEIKSSPEKFFDLIVGKQHQVSSLCPSFIRGFELREGEMGQAGSIVLWRYVLDGEEKMMMETMESKDLENNQVTFKVLDGDLMKEYTHFSITLRVTSKEGGVGSVAHWHFKYAKIHKKVADPHSLLQFAVEISKVVDEHLSSW